MGKYTSIGGFDVERGRPKPMKRAVPAGSVYYFELLEGDLEKVKDLMTAGAYPSTMPSKALAYHL